MTFSTKIACIGANYSLKILGTGIILIGLGEAINWAVLTYEARREG